MNNFIATETETSSFEDIPEYFQILRNRITLRQKEYNFSDHYIIDLKEEKTRRRVCCDEWPTIECIMREAIGIPECGQKAVDKLLKISIIPSEEEIYKNLCKQYTDYKRLCDSEINPLYDYEPMIWIAITSIFIFGLIITFPDVLTNCLRFLFR